MSADDNDLSNLSGDQLAAEVQKLRQGIRRHRDSTGHDLCWYHPALWGLLPEKTDPLPTVPGWPQFIRGCLAFRQSLDRQAPAAPRVPVEFAGAAGEAAATVVEQFWTLMATNDFTAVGAILADDYVLEWPQSGERIRGREKFAAMNAAYPAVGRWEFHVHRIVGGDGQAVSDVTVTDGARRDRSISFFSVAYGRILRQVEFWPEPYPAPAQRQQFVESMK
jgi:limonene-1,2-epoxide hydrolase